MALPADEPLVSLGYLLDEARSISGKKPAFRSLSERVRHWLGENVTERGLFAPNPAETMNAAGLLLDLREELGGKGWRKKDDAILASMLNGSSHGLARGVSLQSQEAISTKVWKKRLDRIKREKGLAEPAGVVSALLLAGKLKRAMRDGRELGIHCDESGWSVLRSEWSSRGAHLAIRTQADRMSLEFRVRGEVIVVGGWETKVLVDGVALGDASSWENIGWNSDDGGDYVEYRQHLTDEWVLERVVFLSRETGLLFVLDALQGKSAGRLQLETTWKTTEWKDVHAGDALRCIEGSSPGGLGLRVVPLAASALVQEPSSGNATWKESSLRWWQEANAQRLAVPLVLEWDKKGLAKARPWRRLTITNDGPAMSSSEAVGYRLWHQGKNVVLFRSLLGTRRMAFLGHQTFYETLIGEFKKDGTMRDWLSVDADPDTPWDYFGALTHRQHTDFHANHPVQRDR
jgi:hypothetical protein